MNCPCHLAVELRRADRATLRVLSNQAPATRRSDSCAWPRSWSIGLALMLWLCSGPACAQWTVGQLDALAQAFATGISGGYKVTAYPWRFMATCSATYCFNNNPDGTYGMPDFGMQPGQAVAARTLAPTGALVLVMETPPPMRYFGVTPYIFTKYYADPPGRPSQPTTVTVFESLTDTTNLVVIGTTGSAVPGSNVHTQLSVFVVTADAQTYGEIARQFLSLGFPAYAINQLDLPLAVEPAVPLKMGTSPRSDTYAVLLRSTYPEDAARMADYVQRAPVRSFYVSPRLARAVSLLAPTVYRVPGSGQAEPGELSAAQGQLVNLLLARYGDEYARITELQVPVMQTRNYAAVARGASANGDNPDALYTAAGRGSLAPAFDDRILVVGVNHGAIPDGTGKATYFSHSLTVAENGDGVLSVPDTWLAGTALTAAGITDPGDPRFATYRRLYAFTMGYNCPSGDTLCVTIPQPTPEGGVAIGTPVRLVGRIYLDPATKTRPSRDEITFERAFFMSNATARPR